MLSYPSPLWGPRRAKLALEVDHRERKRTMSRVGVDKKRTPPRRSLRSRRPSPLLADARGGGIKIHFARSGVSFSPLLSNALRNRPLALASVMNLLAYSSDSG